MKVNDSKYPAQFHYLKKWLGMHRIFITFMEEMLQTAELILEGHSNYSHHFSMLYHKVKNFTKEYSRYTKEEETILLPLLADIMGEENGALAVWICENEQISFHLEAFLKGQNKNETIMPLPAVKGLVYHIIELEERLSDHIHNEEIIIFPLAAKSILHLHEAILQ